MRRAIIFNYNSIFANHIIRTVQDYNILHPENGFSIDIYNAEEYPFESMAGLGDIIIHTGGDGTAVGEDIQDIPKLYICHSHEWKGVKEGGTLVKLKGLLKGVQIIDILEDNEILGRKGKMPIMKYHELAVIKAPPSAKVLAISKAINALGDEIDIIEALQYPDGSISIQGHPEEGTAAHIFYNFFERRPKWSFLRK